MIYYNNRTPPDRTFSLGMPRPSLTRLRQQLAGTRPGLLLALCVALLFAQLDRPTPVPVALPTLAPPPQALPRAATPARREPSRPPLPRYDARGPPTR